MGFGEGNRRMTNEVLINREEHEQTRMAWPQRMEKGTGEALQVIHRALGAAKPKKIMVQYVDIPAAK